MEEILTGYWGMAFYYLVYFILALISCALLYKFANFDKFEVSEYKLSKSEQMITSMLFGLLFPATIVCLIFILVMSFIKRKET